MPELKKVRRNNAKPEPTLAADSRLGGGVVRSWARKFLLQRSPGNRWLEGTTGGRTVIVAWLASCWKKKNKGVQVSRSET